MSRIVYLVLLIAYACKLDMVQHYKWIAYGCDGLGGKGAKRQRLHAHAPGVALAPARFGARFPSHWFLGIVRHLEGCGVLPSCLRIILSSVRFEGNEISVACACTIV